MRAKDKPILCWKCLLLNFFSVKVVFLHINGEDFVVYSRQTVFFLHFISPGAEIEF